MTTFNKEDVDETCEDFEAYEDMEKERVFKQEMRDEMGADDIRDYLPEVCKCRFCQSLMEVDAHSLCVCFNCGEKCSVCF